MKWMLASRPARSGRLYWSKTEAWTYKELGTLYDYPQTFTLQSMLLSDRPIWLQVEIDHRGIIKVLDDHPQSRTSIKRPHCIFTPNTMYRVKVYFKETAA
jgi:hypothetical protein